MIPVVPRLYLGLGIAAGVLVVLFGFFLWGSSAGKAADAKRTAPIISKLQTDLAQCNLTVSTQEGALSSQNAAIDRLQFEGEQRAKEASTALRQAQNQADRYRKRAEQIAAAKPTGDQCIASRNLIIETLGEDRK